MIDEENAHTVVNPDTILAHVLYLIQTDLLWLGKISVVVVRIAIGQVIILELVQHYILIKLRLGNYEKEAYVYASIVFNQDTTNVLVLS